MAKKITSLLLALVLALSLAGAALAREELPFMELSYVSWYCGEIVDDNWAEKLLQDRFNVEIKTSRVDLSNTTQVSLMLASGEMPECGWQMGTPPTLYDQGLTRTIPEDMIRTYAPNYAALLDANPLGWRYFAAPEEGNYLGLTGFSASVNAYMLAIRLDWMENLGMALPEDMVALDDEGRLMVTNQAYTMSELYDILHAFTYDDPDGNGQNDTVGLSACNGMDQFFWMPLFSAYGMAMNRASVNVDGVAENYYVSPQYRQFLTYMAKAYADGLVDKEFATVDRQTAWEKYLNGRTGVSGTMGAWASTLPAFATRPPMSILSATEDGKILLTPSPTEDGQNNTSPAYTYTSFNYAFVVRADVSDEKLARILTIFDYVNFDDEAKVLFRYGVEGEHFTFENPETRNGVILNEGVKNGGETGLMVYNSNYILESDINTMNTNAMTNRLIDAFMDGYKAIQAKPYRLDLFNETRLTELNDLYGATLSTLTNEYFYNVICGEVDLDASWDAYVKTLEQAGYAEIREELQKAPLFSDLVQ